MRHILRHAGDGIGKREVMAVHQSGDDGGIKIRLVRNDFLPEQANLLSLRYLSILFHKECEGLLQIGTELFE